MFSFDSPVSCDLTSFVRALRFKRLSACGNMRSACVATRFSIRTLFLDIEQIPRTLVFPTILGLFSFTKKQGLGERIEIWNNSGAVCLALEEGNLFVRTRVS